MAFKPTVRARTGQLIPPGRGSSVKRPAIVKTATITKKQTVTARPTTSPKPLQAVSDVEAEAKAFIYFKESTNRTDAINPSSGACGLGQALPCSKLPCSLQDRACQDDWFTDYAMRRYGSWLAAKQFWLANSWW